MNTDERTGPVCKALRGPQTGGRSKDRLMGWRMWQSLGTDNDPPADSTLTVRL